MSTSQNDQDAELVEGKDYVLDSVTGFLIFTRDYLLRRGTCCLSGCLNCPYGFVGKEE